MDAAVTVYGFVMALLASSLIVRRENGWPLAWAICGCAVGLALTLRL